MLYLFEFGLYGVGTWWHRCRAIGSDKADAIEKILPTGAFSREELEKFQVLTVSSLESLALLSVGSEVKVGA